MTPPLPLRVGTHSLGWFGRLFLAATLSLYLLPVSAFADEGTLLSGFVDRVVASDRVAIEEFRVTGDPSVLRNTHAYDYPANAIAPLANDVFPSKYSLVDEGVVTPVKLQNPWGTCWSFGGTAAAEVSLLSELGLTYDETQLDLSELHTAWMANTPLSDGSSQDGEGIHTTSSDDATVLSQSGFPFTLTSVYSSGIGPVPESVAPYKNKAEKKEEIATPSGPIPVWYSKEGDWSVDQSLRFEQLYQLEESSILPSPAERGAGVEAMKRELMQGRAVDIAFCSDQTSTYINNTTWSHYTYEEKPINHSVCVVGWDDNYPKTNFLPDHQPPNDGAWLVKNSWGAASRVFPNWFPWGADGYFWISFDDKSISLPETFDFYTGDAAQGAEYWLISQYDYMPTEGAFPMAQSQPSSMANVFTAGERMSVFAVSSETATPGTTVTYDIYRLADDATSPIDGEQAVSFQKFYEYGGYHREMLATPLIMEAGQRYSVVVTLQVGGEYQVLLQRNYNKTYMEEVNKILPPDQQLHRWSEGVVNKGESYVSENGVWEDWAVSVANLHAQAVAQNADFYSYDNFSIKAYGEPAPALVIVPDLTGLTEADALAALGAVGLKGVAGKAEYSDTVAAGHVIRQDVAAGTEVSKDTAITYVLSLGKQGTGSGDTTSGSTLAETRDSALPIVFGGAILAVVAFCILLVERRRRRV
ncbi:PASTA domain-containing protein [Eggerthella sp. YY7918]|uniref:PASTA domain-containing protein n=1 Tax=Eggerthella sp. (strain YY7918) TaxID=502558 RepID=UPI00021713E1|nr:PASTA domain-containing protein [Eggerthella sp. YY7918]BAK44830.1 hypothetical protein EGYY_16900 [Eggerthella sp. YY7918]